MTFCVKLQPGQVHDIVICVCFTGGGGCDPGESNKNNVVLFGRSESRKDHVLLDILPYSAYRVQIILSLHTVLD